MLTVSGSTGQGIGINLGNKSALGVSGGLLVQNNTGTSGNGINITNGSQVTLYPTSSKAVVVQNNGYGIRLWDGSGVSGGVSSGGTITITPNTSKDLTINFGSRANLPASSFSASAVQCSQSLTAASMGITSCWP